MGLKCYECGKNLRNMIHLKCTQCTKSFDLSCLAITKECYNNLSQNDKDIWNCPYCVGSSSKETKEPKEEQATSARPARVTTAASLNNSFTCDNVSKSNRRANAKSKAQKEEMDPSAELATLIAELPQLRQIVIEAKQDNTEFIKQMSSIMDNLTLITKEQGKRLQNVEGEIDSIKTSIEAIKFEMGTRDQEGLRKDLEITGLAEKENEDLFQTVIATSRKIGVDLSETEISDVIRIGPKPRKDGEPNRQRKPRPVVVQLVRKKKYDELIKAAKVRHNMIMENLVDGCLTPVYLNERLTKANRQLFHEARGRSKEHDFRFCWVRNGGIYVRKCNGKPAIRINKSSDLDRKVGPMKQDEETQE